MCRDYPLQQQARHHASRSQTAFARRAKSVLRQPQDCALHVSAAGLTLLAKHEEALARPVATLKKAFGADLRLSAPQVRLIGAPPLEPIMNVRINVPVSRVDTVKRHLQRRSVLMHEESCGGTRCLLRCEAPLARLLGLDTDLQCLTLGSSLVWTSLARYEPISSGPDAA
jgi:predicted membrane GTPase involved in stress response